MRLASWVNSVFFLGFSSCSVIPYPAFKYYNLTVSMFSLGPNLSFTLPVPKHILVIESWSITALITCLTLAIFFRSSSYADLGSPDTARSTITFLSASASTCFYRLLPRPIISLERSLIFVALECLQFSYITGFSGVSNTDDDLKPN